MEKMITLFFVSTFFSSCFGFGIILPELLQGEKEAKTEVVQEVSLESTRETEAKEEVVEVEIVEHENEVTTEQEKKEEKVRAEKVKADKRSSIFPVLCEDAFLISGYGMRNDPINGKKRFHHGIDISAVAGTLVVATHKGVVAYAGWKGGMGNTVIIDTESGHSFYYAHLQSISVEEGEKLSAEDKVGKVGSSGRTTGSHLHYEVRKNGESIDPQKKLIF